MTTQKKLILKIAIVMILIVGAPILYFLSLGNNPLSGEAGGTKQIAVVNEDAGAEMLDDPLDFGKEVVPILSAESNYEWSVVSRSAAENGLANQDYDAILYIPSNFSENIMTYEELQPVKPEFKYTVSGQLNTANREKVLREIDNAAARVNGKISTLYWSYVSQDLEKVRQEFDNILQKEMEFLETISEYYRPGL
ncbi:type VII secretion protein EsaA, partial [Butyricicoccus sp. 1XD8-22]